LGASGIGKVNLPPERHVTWRLLASSKTISFFDGPETDDRLGHNLDLFLSPDAHNLEISENFKKIRIAYVFIFALALGGVELLTYLGLSPNKSCKIFHADIWQQKLAVDLP
jgi:hypothetical protein